MTKNEIWRVVWNLKEKNDMMLFSNFALCRTVCVRTDGIAISHVSVNCVIFNSQAIRNSGLGGAGGGVNIYLFINTFPSFIRSVYAQTDDAIVISHVSVNYVIFSSQAILNSFNTRKLAFV